MERRLSANPVDNSPPVGAQRQAGNASAAPQAGLDKSPGVRVPDHQFARRVAGARAVRVRILAAADDAPATRTERHAGNRAGVPLEGADLLADVHIPYLQFSRLARVGQVAAAAWGI